MRGLQLGSTPHLGETGKRILLDNLRVFVFFFTRLLGDILVELDERLHFFLLILVDSEVFCLNTLSVGKPALDLAHEALGVVRPSIVDSKRHVLETQPLDIFLQGRHSAVG